MINAPGVILLFKQQEVFKHRLYGGKTKRIINEPFGFRKPDFKSSVHLATQLVIFFFFLSVVSKSRETHLDKSPSLHSTSPNTYPQSCAGFEEIVLPMT